MAQRKESKKTIKVRDLKPKKDAKGGRVPPGMPQGSGHSVQSRSLNSSTRSI
jgi:hypothetical protein